MKSRNFKNYNRETYVENVRNHYKFLETLYEPKPETIAKNIQQIIANSIDPIAPVQKVQVSSRMNSKISIKSKELLADRDTAYQEYKRTKNPEQLTLYKNLKKSSLQKYIYRKLQRKNKKIPKWRIKNPQRKIASIKN